MRPPTKLSHWSAINKKVVSLVGPYLDCAFKSLFNFLICSQHFWIFSGWEVERRIDNCGRCCDAKAAVLGEDCLHCWGIPPFGYTSQRRRLYIGGKSLTLKVTYHYNLFRGLEDFHFTKKTSVVFTIAQSRFASVGLLWPLRQASHILWCPRISVVSETTYLARLKLHPGL